MLEIKRYSSTSPSPDLENKKDMEILGTEI